MTEKNYKSGFELEQWTVYPLLGQLSDGSSDHHLEPKVMGVLVRLAENSGELVSRDDIIDRVWEGRPVSDDGLSRCIAELRKILGDDTRHPRFIETVPKRGYRLLPFATPLSKAEAAASVNVPAARGRRWLHPGLVGLAATIVIATISVAGVFLLTARDKPESAGGDTIYAPDRHTIAVLPFENRSDVPADSFMVAGLHDDLLTQLAQLDEWNVISRTSVEQFRGTDALASDIGARLNATLILEGGMQRRGDAVRINVQLIDSQRDKHLWAETYDTDLSVDDLFDVQSKIVASIVEELAGTLQFSGGLDVEAPTHSHVAYNDYVKGRRMVQTESVTSLNAAVEHFKAAIDIDDGYAEAYAALADAYLSLGIYFVGGLSYEEAVASAEPLILRALELDPDLPQAHAANGLMQTLVFDSRAAEEALEKAIDLQPSYPRAYRLLANLRWRQLRPDVAITLAEHAESLDPLSGPIRLELGRYYEAVGRFDNAMEKYVGAANLMPDNALSRIYIGALKFLVFGDVAESLIWYHEAAELDPESPSMQTMPAIAYLELGDVERAARFVDRGMTMNSDIFWPRYAHMLLSLRTGDDRGAVEDAKALLAAYPLSPDGLRTLRDRDLAEGAPERALARYTKAHPELTEPEEPQIDARNLFATVDLARVHAALGDADRATTLTEHALELVQARHRLGTQGYWLADVQALAIQGRSDEAVERLESAIDEGYRIRLWYHLYLDPNLDNLRELPAYQALLERVDVLVATEFAHAVALRDTLQLE